MDTTPGNPKGLINEQDDAQDGLGDKPVPANGSRPPNYGSSSRGNLLGQKAGAATVTLDTRTLTESLSYDAGSDGANGGYGMSYSVAVTNYSLTINLTGTTPDSNKADNILVGQGCLASVSATGCTVSAPYSWTVNGATFQSWTASSSSATLVTGMGPANNPTAHWYWSDTAGQKTVRCTAMVTPPAGQGSAFSLTVTKQVNLQVPLYSASPTPGRVQINGSYPGQSGYWLYAGQGTFGPSRGIQWKVKVPTPPLFVAQSGGGWYFDQIVTPGRWKTPFGGSERPWPINGMVGLDKSHPYPAPSGSPAPPPSMPTGSFAANSTEVSSGDSPAQPVENNYTNYRVMESFRTYVMYVPPGGDIQPVPLHEIDWNWKTNGSSGVQKPDGGWSSWPDSNDAGTVAYTLNTKQSTHPQWAQLTVPPASW